MQTQPVPNVTRDDVLRVIRRDFAETSEVDVLHILDQYGTQGSVAGQARVHLAILKLSGSGLDALRNHIETACFDCRDVIAPAEYPEYSKHGFKKHFADDDKAAAIESDWKQYEEWLNKE